MMMNLNFHSSFPPKWLDTWPILITFFALITYDNNDQHSSPYLTVALLSPPGYLFLIFRPQFTLKSSKSVQDLHLQSTLMPWGPSHLIWSASCPFCSVRASFGSHLQRGSARHPDQDLWGIEVLYCFFREFQYELSKRLTIKAIAVTFLSDSSS